MSHIWVRNVMSNTYEWVMSPTYEWVMSHIWVRNVMSHTFEWVMSHMSEKCHVTHIRMSHVTHMSEKCHVTHIKWVMSHIWMSHVPHMNESCHTYEWEMSVATPYLRLSDRYIGLFWLGYRALLRIYRALLWIYRALLRVKDGSQRCDFFFLTHMSEKCRHTYEWVMSYIWVRHVRHKNESCHT